MSDRINIIMQAPAFSQSGYGYHARDLIMGLFNSGKYNISLIPVGWGASTTYEARKDIDDSLIFMCNNRISQGVPFVWVQMGVPHEFKRVAPINIGITAGSEAEPYPKKWADYCNQMTALIVPSKYVKDQMILCGVKIPIFIVPEGVDISAYNNTDSPATSITEKLDNLSTTFNFLVVGQWLFGNMHEDRKNIPFSALVAIDALLEHNDVGVIIKTHLHNASSPDKYTTIERLTNLMGPKAKGRVHLIHGTLTDEEMASMYKHKYTKAFLSMTHGEGFGRQIIEACACDLPILVTGYGGQMDFVKPDLATILEYNMIDLPQACIMPELLLPGMKWAEVDYDKAKNRLRRCYETYPIAKQRAVDLGKIIRSDWTLERSNTLLLDAFNTICKPSSINPGGMGGNIII